MQLEREWQMVLRQPLWKSMPCSLIPTMMASFILGKHIKVLSNSLRFHPHTFLSFFNFLFLSNKLAKLFFSFLFRPSQFFFFFTFNYYLGFRKIGSGVLLSLGASIFIHGLLSSKTRPVSLSLLLNLYGCVSMHLCVYMNRYTIKFYIIYYIV